MALDWEAWELALLEGGGVRPAVLLRVETAPVIRLWLGALRDVSIPADNVEGVEGAVYQSMGYVTEIPTLNQLVNGQAARVEFSLSGVVVTGEVADLASGSAADIRGARVNVGFMAFDANWQQGTPVLWPWEGEADSLTVERRGDPEGAMRTLKLSVGSALTGRRRAQTRYNTNNDQHLRSADDNFFDQIRRYNSGSTKVWPR
jgi:hypothetical protein